MKLPKLYFLIYVILITAVFRREGQEFLAYLGVGAEPQVSTFSSSDWKY